MTEKKNIDYRVAKLSMKHVARAIEMNQTNGMMTSIVCKETDKILGFSMLGVEAGEIMSVLQLAIENDMTYHEIREHVFAHPTITE